MAGPVAPGLQSAGSLLPPSPPARPQAARGQPDPAAPAWRGSGGRFAPAQKLVVPSSRFPTRPSALEQLPPSSMAKGKVKKKKSLVQNKRAKRMINFLHKCSMSFLTS